MAIIPGDSQVQGELKTWHKITLDFAGPLTSETDTGESSSVSPNPFLHYRLDVIFTNADTGETLVVPGYFAADGDAANTGATSGDVWRAHFNPPSAGTWTYTASFRTGADVAASANPGAGTPLAGFDGQSGSFTVGPTDKAGADFRAKGMIEHAGDNTLVHAGTGETFVKGGAGSPENFLAYEGFDGTIDSGGKVDNFLHGYQSHVGDWQAGDPTWRGGEGKGIIGAVNYLASESVNSQYFLTMNVGGDGDDVWPWTGPNNHATYDVSKLDQWEIVFDHMDRSGVLLHVFTQEQENDQLLNGGDLGVERAVYYRELIARFGHHNGVMWNLGEENTNTGAQRKAFSDFFKAVDPYDHPIDVHTFPSQKGTVYDPLLGHPTFDGASLQIGGSQNTHDTVIQWVDKSKDAGRPWIVSLDEIGPALDGLAPDSVDPTHDGPRADHLWGALMAGSAGTEWYFGYDHPHDDLSLEDYRSRDLWWDQVRHAGDFVELLPYEEMAHADQLLPQNAGLTAAEVDDYALVKAGEVYAAYIEDGGTTELDLTGATGTFEIVWYDPRQGGSLQTGTIAQIEGGSVVDLGQAPGQLAEDWAVLVLAAGISEPPPGGQTPTDLAVTPAAFDEEAAYSGTLTATDPDTTDPAAFSYALLQDTSGLFAVSGDQLSLIQPVDFENLPAGFTDNGDGTATTVLTLEVRDESGNAYQEDLALTVSDLDETTPPPQAVRLAAKAGVLDGTTGPQQWSGQVTLSALAPDGTAAVVTHTIGGFGVQGGRTNQLDHIPSNDTTEQFVLEFSGAVTDVVLQFFQIDASEEAGKRETGTWTAYDAAGTEVASGALDPAAGTQVATLTYDIPVATAEPFAKLAVEATGYNGGTSGASGDSSDFALKRLTYSPADGTATSILAPDIRGEATNAHQEDTDLTVSEVDELSHIPLSDPLAEADVLLIG